ncbi:MAG: metallophosphoesterase [Prevotella sp.]|jgi:predicted MPP superfamily phosphohydrolase|nr:metallophosphoesterase [Prevotella sp.]
MKIKLRHNTAMRLITGSCLLIAVPAVLFLVVWPFAGWCWALLLPILWEMLMAYGFFFGWRHVIVRRATCVSPLLPASFNGYRVLQLSDIHIGTYLRNRRFIDKLVALVNDQHADLVVFTGDLVNVSAEEVIPFQHVLKQVSATDGVLSIMGNHDYCEYGEDKSERNVAKNQTVLHYLEEKIGWHLLMNEHVLIHRGDDAIAIIGVENISRPPFQDYGDLKKAMEGLPQGMFKILLSHDPSHWRRGVLHQTDIALTLSGHTHAGQLRVGRLSPSKVAYQEWGGKYTEDGSMLYVSTGIGGTVPFRLGAWPEINIITLQRGENK